MSVSDAAATRCALAARVALGAMVLVIATLPFAHSIAVRNVALAFAIVTAICGRRALGVPRVPLLWFFVLFAAVGGLSLLTSIDPAYSRHELKSELVYPLAIFVCAFAVSRDHRSLGWLAGAAAIATAIALPGAVVAWLMRWVAFFADPTRSETVAHLVWDVLLYNGAGFYSTWLIVVYPFALAAWLSPALARRERRIALAIAALCIVGGFFTFNRAFALVAVFQTVALGAWRLMRQRAQASRSALVATAVLTVFLLITLHVTQHQRYGPTSGSAAVDSELALGIDTDIRWTIWKETTQHILATPWHGEGFGRGIARKELRERFPNNPLWHAHNLEVNWGLQMGLPGVLLAAALFAGALWHLVRAYRTTEDILKPYVAAAIVMVVGMFLKNQTDDLFVRQTAMAFWAALGAILGISARIGHAGHASSGSA